MPHKTSLQAMPAMLGLLSPAGRQSFNNSPTAATESSPSVTALPPLASAQYVQQCHTVMSQQRKMFESERELWSIEKQGLIQRITDLEESLQHLQDVHSELASHNKGKSAQNRGWDETSTYRSRPSSSSTVGEELVKLSNTGMTPTRRFSESFEPGKATQKLSSINEDSTQDRHVSICTKTENIPTDASMAHKSTIAGADIDKDLDGITFKASAIDPNIVKSVFSSGSASPMTSAETERAINKGYSLFKEPDSSASDELNEPNRTLNAGHTPISEHPHLLLSADGASSRPGSAIASPDPAPVKRPSERRDSYFPNVHPDTSLQQPEPDEDPALKGPLGLTDDSAENTKFLDNLQRRLSQEAEKSNTSEEIQEATGESCSASRGEEEEGGEPKLKIKRSLNFGSQLGGGSL
ncbi:uncharacterized protein KY384_000450 [Bacidia gigantensis]|uniref:uncharacterized protein n=1 Tax=Bacidia gigantensis TaxID=2732470 RepID=UPI001D044964|nr:uncharacterized protein KY384_000450 [Bacidia gigantensis]KAG8525690.1 hypothetical protein KY384_000450 [Bacidia gigantensis]